MPCLQEAARRKALKTGKGKRAAEPAPNPNPNNASIGIIPPFEGEDSAASFQGPNVLTMEQRVHHARKAKLMRIPIVDTDIEHRLVAHGSSRGSRGSSSSSSSSDVVVKAPLAPTQIMVGKTYPVALLQVPPILICPRHQAATQKPHREARSIAVWLYILEGR